MLKQNQNQDQNATRRVRFAFMFSFLLSLIFNFSLHYFYGTFALIIVNFNYDFKSIIMKNKQLLQNVPETLKERTLACKQIFKHFSANTCTHPSSHTYKYKLITKINNNNNSSEFDSMSCQRCQLERVFSFSNNFCF